MVMSTSFHPQTDDESEKTIQTLEDMIRACILDLKGSKEEHLSLVEFAYNNSNQASIQMAPYEALYGRPCRSPVCWTEVGKRTSTGPNLVKDTSKNVGIDTEVSSHSSEPVEELRQQTAVTSRV